MSRRAKKPTIEPTAIDAIVVALSPALIIGMVACLVFFLVVAFYRGEYDQRLMYILGLFTLATVLIARIAIESGRSYANAFSFPLAIVSVIAMFRFVTVTGPLGPISPLINVILLAVAWYLADRITFDCTLVDERDGGVQQGLLQSLGLLKRDALPTQNIEQPTSPTRLAEPTSKASEVPAAGEKPAGGQAKKKKKKRHNPGVWVLYFSLLAFPLFGLGQLAIPDDASRSTAFYFLVGYLGCALGLLSATSFISTRRYVRHRGASMPAEMSRSWLGYAGAGIFALLVGCLLLPLPGRSMGLVGLPFELKSPDGLQTSRWGWGSEGQEQSGQEQAGQELGPAAEAGAARAAEESDRNSGGKPQAEGKGAPQASDQAKDDAANATGDGEKSGGESGSQSQTNDSQGGEQQSKGQQSKGQQSSEQQSSEQQSSEQQSSEQQSSEQQAGAGRSRKEQTSPHENRQQQPENRQATSDDRKGEKASENADPGKEQPGDKQSGGKQSQKEDTNREDTNRKEANKEESEDSAESNNDQPAAKQSPPSTSSNWFNWLPTGLAEIIKWLTIAILALVVILYAITHPREILQLWRDMLDFFARLFGGGAARESTAERDRRAASAAAVERRPFRSFANPFAGNLQGWTPEQAIHQTFAAMEAWAAERGRQRQSDETAAEFAKHLGRRVPSVEPHAATAARMLDELMFAGWKPTAQDIAPLAAVWLALNNPTHSGVGSTSPKAV